MPSLEGPPPRSVKGLRAHLRNSLSVSAGPQGSGLPDDLRISCGPSCRRPQLAMCYLDRLRPKRAPCFSEAEEGELLGFGSPNAICSKRSLL
jgi:hypothetical protein